VVTITFFSVSFLKSDKNLFRNLLAIKAGFWVSVFFGWLRLENAYIKKSKLGLGFTLEFARIRLLCFTLLMRTIWRVTKFRLVYLPLHWVLSAMWLCKKRSLPFLLPFSCP
jgi:hypothetical protein